MQSSVKKTESIRMGSGVLKIGGFDVGAIRGGNLEVEVAVSQVAFSNAKLPPRNKIISVKFSATLVELTLDNIKKVYGGDLATVDAASNTDNPGNERKVLTFDDLVRIVAKEEVTFVHTDADGKQFGLKIFEGYASNGLSFGFNDDDDLESVSELPIEYSAYPTAQNKMFEIFDESAIA